LRASEGRDQVLLRSEIDELESTGRSLMPEGLEKDLTRQDLADLIAFLGNPQAAAPTPAAPAAPAEAAQTGVADLAKQILDDTRPPIDRQAIIDKNPEKSADLIVAMIADLPNAKEEYRRIPWLQRIAVAAGKRNDAAELKRLLEVSLPKPNEPLRDWQAVVIGGGIIAGVSDQKVWPKARIGEVIGQGADLLRRWHAIRDQAANLADDLKSPLTTRGAALRIVALGTWEKRRAQLLKYVAQDAQPELQAVAISALANVDANGVAERLIAALPALTPANRGAALDGLVRTESRAMSLLDAVERGRLDPTYVGEGHRQALRAAASASVRTRAANVFSP
jgi:hypothetical protein